ncbi:MAG: cell division protein FtsA [Patescibacteria group bacterium]|nr:cell division protein FtsA [Patescibacteria group bacterium]MDD3778161.1 cell division protein FtsA [Patescibacteria group bacterium]MDD3939546.1 cell division protein FtsA [Patescibacteria group bacterium]MDD4443714.1 cell division protein FtsA [Patescibacteria group bacterium]NCU39425.1 cell division protein FtsA [Candidatus Falkowbacteria bacterium]
MKEDIIAGLDIGSTSIRLVIGQKISGPAGEELQIIGAVSGPTAGVNRGIVNSIEETTSSISAVLEKAERLVGVPINRVWVGINDPHIKCERSKGVVAVGRSDGEISDNDVNRAIEAARALAVPVNYEILHVIPIKFSVDNQSDVKDPIGMNGIRLEVETLIIQGLSTQIKNLTKAIYRTGLEIEDLVLAPLAAAEAVISSKQKELGVALINLGSSTTSLAVYEERNLIHTAVLPIGAEHITADVAIGLRCPINLAERVKKEYGSAIVIAGDNDDEIDVSQLVVEEEINDDIDTISKKYVSEIINARVEEIFEKVDAEFKKIDRSGMLPAGVIFVGGGSDLTGLVEAAKKKLRLPAAIGVAKNINVVIDKVRNPDFLIALGLVIWGDNAGGDEMTGGGSIKKNINGILEKTRGFFNKIIPK